MMPMKEQGQRQVPPGPSREKGRLRAAASGLAVAEGMGETLDRGWLFLHPGPLEAEPEARIVASGFAGDALRMRQGLCWRQPGPRPPPRVSGA